MAVVEIAAATLSLILESRGVLWWALVAVGMRAPKRGMVKVGRGGESRAGDCKFLLFFVLREF